MLRIIKKRYPLTNVRLFPVRVQGVEAPGEIAAAIRYANQYQLADVLIIGGTSLVVYPAAALIHYYRGNKLVLINRDRTSQDDYADLVIRDKIGEVFSRI